MAEVDVVVCGGGPGGARAELTDTDTGTTLTRERWLLVLFDELGYGRLQTAGRQEIEGTSYLISHMWGRAPIHLVTFRQHLDRRSTVATAVRRSPHSLMQEFLNRSDDHLWGFFSNGLRLRILRDNVSLTRTAYVELDLETMMRGEQYADFTLLWSGPSNGRGQVGENMGEPYGERPHDIECIGDEQQSRQVDGISVRPDLSHAAPRLARHWRRRRRACVGSCGCWRSATSCRRCRQPSRVVIGNLLVARAGKPGGADRRVVPPSAGVGHFG